MSIASRLEALKETYDNKNASLRILFEQRLDTLRNNIISFIGNALHDETAAILNESDTTRAFVVDRILEIVSENLESEKETTIFKLINKVNLLTKECDTLTIKNTELKEDNDSLTDKQQHINNDSEALQTLKQTIAEKELKIKTQCDKIKSTEDELQIKTHEFERQQTQNDEQHEQIQKLHEKLENALKNLQHQQTEFDQQSIESKHIKHIHDMNQKELKKNRKQIDSLRAGLMKSESERLVLSKQYMEIGHKLEAITKDQNKQMQQFDRDENNKNNEILLIKQQFQELMIENKALKRKLHEQSHSLSKKMKKELTKTKTLCDDVTILRKQLESERNISKMYVDELQKLKMEVNTKNTEINYNERKLNDAISSQKKKIHKYYQKMVDSNMSQLRDEYESHIKELKQLHEGQMLKIQNDEQQKITQKEKEFEEQISANKAQCNADKEKWNSLEVEVKEWREKWEEYKIKYEGLDNEIEKYQKENEELRDELTVKNNKITDINTKNEEEKESLQRLMYERQKQNEDLTNILSKLKKQKDDIQQNKFEDNSKANAIEFDLKQKLECVTLELQQMKKENKSIKLKLNHQNSSKQLTEKSNWKYQQKLNVIRGFCRNIRREIRNNKNEIEYIKSSVSMHTKRVFHDMKISFDEIQTQSTKYVLKKNETQIKQQLTQSMDEFKLIQNLKLKSMEQQVKCAIIDTNKIEDINMKELDIDQLQNEVDTIKQELAQAKTVLSPRRITFKKISLPSSIGSSMMVSNAPSPHPAKVHQSVKKEAIKASKDSRRESFDTASIRKLRSDLQSLESNYKYTKKQTKRKYSGSDSMTNNM